MSSYKGLTVRKQKIIFICRQKNLNFFFVVIPGDRAMPTMSTGMEAEEETEHHLMRALATETV